MNENNTSEDYCTVVGPNKNEAEDESLYVEPMPMSCMAKQAKDTTDTVYETPSSILLKNTGSVAEKNAKNVKKSNMLQFKSTLQHSEAALSKALKFPKKMLSSDHFLFNKEAKKRTTSVPVHSNEDYEDIYVEVGLLRKNEFQTF